MGWSTVPVSAGDAGVIAAMTEVKAAFDERYDAVGASFGKPTAVTAGDFGDWSEVIAHYHTKIEALLTSFYKKSGSGESTTFAAYTKDSLLTECFSQTEWRDTAEGLATIRQVNDLRTALNKLEWLMVSRDAGEYTAHAYYSVNVSAGSKAATQSAFDGDTSSPQLSTSSCRAGCSAGYGIDGGGNYWMNGQRDYHGICGYDVPDITVSDAYIVLPLYNVEAMLSGGSGGNAPENTASYKVYTGTAAPTETFAGVRAYGSLRNTVNITSLYKNSNISLNVPAGLSGNQVNFIRIAGPSIANSELDDMTWPSAGTIHYWWVRTDPAPGGAVNNLYLQAQFSYRA